MDSARKITTPPLLNPPPQGGREQTELIATLRYPSRHSREDPVALQVDDLLGLRDGKRNRVVAVRVGVGAYETVLAYAVGTVFLGGGRSLISAVRPVRRRLDANALVLDGLGRRTVRGGPARSRGQAGKHRLEFREHRSSSFNRQRISYRI